MLERNSASYLTKNLVQNYEEDAALRTCLKATAPIGPRSIGLLVSMMLMLPCMVGIKGASIYPGYTGSEQESASHVISDADAGPVMSCADSYCEPTPGYFQSLSEAADRCNVVHFSGQCPGTSQNKFQVERLLWYHTRGNLSFRT